jgi:2-polyprenyl-3-methyl-5-hydroxy-6-metoxy-1,4-benzoquinol methylase
VIEFRCQDTVHKLEGGESYDSPPKECYRDTEAKVLEDLNAEIRKGLPWREAARRQFEQSNPWLFKIVTHESRNRFIKEQPPNASELVLDIGAGWGQAALPLAKTNKVCALEPTAERLAFIKAAAKQENVTENLFFIGSDYMDIEFQTKFDLILSIGVLEWVAAFRKDGEPEEIQASFLAKTKTDLSTGGRLVIGIENRLGLKYLLGANDDHIGIPNVACLKKDMAKLKFKQKTNQELRCLTHSIDEYRKMLKAAGYGQVRFFAALPDYKLPERIFPIEGSKCKMNDFLLNGGWIDEHDGSDGTMLSNQEELKSLYLSLAEMNLAHYFAPSFFIEAS